MVAQGILATCLQRVQSMWRSQGWVLCHDVSVSARQCSLPRRVLTSALATPGVMLSIFLGAPLETKQSEAVKVRLDTFVADVIVPLDVISATNHAVRVTCENKGEQGK